MSIFIGGAWPYANGSLHLGHIASLLPGDILARYYRAKGENVLYVSGVIVMEHRLQLGKTRRCDSERNC